MSRVIDCVLSFRIKFLFLIFRLTKSEHIYNRVDYLVDLKMKNLQQKLTKSRWEKIKLQKDLDYLKEKQNTI